MELEGTFQSSCLICSSPDEEAGLSWDSGFWILCLKHIQIHYLELSVGKGALDLESENGDLQPRFAT